jgi:cell division protein FtsI/penicillin-binding protein 2
MDAPKGDAAIAKIMAGQGARVSPLAMALVAAAVKSGTWRPPVLVTSPVAPDPAAGDGVTQPAAQPVTLDPAIIAKLRTLMRAGVTSGAASAASAPGDPVYGVAAEVTQTEKKERTKLSWFVGWQGDVAVAVLTQSGDTAAASAIAGSFFRDAQPQT